MKYLISIFMLSIMTNLPGQTVDFSDIPAEVLVHLDKMGIDDSLFLNSYESAYFNIIFGESRKDFDFTDKKIAFIDRATATDKAYYFKKERNRFKLGETINDGKLYLLDDKQKKESGGYDAVIVSWNKFVIPKDKLIEILKKNR